MGYVMSKKVVIEVDDNDMALEITKAIETTAYGIAQDFPGTSAMLFRVAKEIKAQTVGTPLDELNEYFN